MSRAIPFSSEAVVRCDPLHTQGRLHRSSRRTQDSECDSADKKCQTKAAGSYRKQNDCNESLDRIRCDERTARHGIKKP
jgi:hypothetical protein